jgi:hypothetical protein
VVWSLLGSMLQILVVSIQIVGFWTEYKSNSHLSHNWCITNEFYLI